MSTFIALDTRCDGRFYRFVVVAHDPVTHHFEQDHKDASREQKIVVPAKESRIFPISSMPPVSRSHAGGTLARHRVGVGRSVVLRRLREGVLLIL